MKWLLDPGHGGMTFGQYLTPGKRSPEVPPGIYEGEFNRAVCSLIQQRDPESIIVIAPGPINIPLASRVSYANQVVRRFKNEHVALISIHANAARKKGWSDANGYRVFHSRKASKKSIILASMVESQMYACTPFDRRPRKAVNHTITTKTKCPACLVECGFMTNKEDATLLADWGVQAQISDAIYRAMKDYEAQL